MALSRMEEVTLGIHVSRKSMHLYSSVSSDWVKLYWPCFLLEARSFLRVMRTSEVFSSREVTLATGQEHPALGGGHGHRQGEDG